MPGNFPALPDLSRLLLFSLLLTLGAAAGAQEADDPGKPVSGAPGDTGAEEPGPGEFGAETSEFAGPPPEDPLPGIPRWFRSNAAGMAMEEVFSRLAAMRNEYALAVDFFPPEELPEILIPYHEAPYRIEVHILYKNGGESRRQWIFRDAGGAARLVAVFNRESSGPSDDEVEESGNGDADGDDTADESGAGNAEASRNGNGDAAPALTGFIEMYNEDGWITAERLFREEGEEDITGFFYRGGRLIRAETERKTRIEEEEKIIPVYTDFYRYNRSASLRAVERIYHEGAADAASPVRLTFPRMILDAAADKDFVSPGISYGSEFLEETQPGAGYRVVYTTDERGRILTETRQDDTGSVIGEQKNNWSGDRLASVLLKTGDDERLTEYEYDGEGNRSAERNYRNGVLERVVRIEGSREIEELYMNGAVILRAIWEDGRKISEERVRPK
jgi:YD repeat-containing protein